MRTSSRRAGSVLSSAAVLSVLGTVAWLGVAGPVSAQPAALAPAGQSCDAVLVDHAGELGGSESSEIERAAREFRSDLAYEIRIRILTQEQAPHLESWIAAEEAACGSWQNTTGGFRDNLVVLAFTTDNQQDTGETVIFYGDQAPAALDGAWPDIQADTINPALNVGDWERGITEGLAEIRDVIDPTPGAGGVIAGIVGGAVGVAGAGAAAGTLAWRRRRQRQALAARFAQTTSELDTLILRLDPRTESLRREIEFVRATVAAEETEEALGESEATLGMADQLIYQRSELSANRDQLLSQRSLSTIEEGVAARERLEKEMRDLLPRLEADESRMASLVAVPDEAPQWFARVDELVAQVRAAVSTAQEAGYVVTADAAILDVCDERVREVRRLLDEKRLLTVREKVSVLTGDLEAARDQLGRLAQREAELGDRLQAVEQAQSGVETEHERARTAEATLRAEFTESLHAPVDGKADEGRRDADRAADIVGQAAEALRGRDLGAAESHLVTAETAQKSARACFAEVTDRLALAEKLRESVPGRKGSVQAKATTLQSLTSQLGSAAPASLRQQATTIDSRLESIVVTGEGVDWIAVNDELAAVENQVTAATSEAEQIRRREEQRRRDAERAQQRRNSTATAAVWGASSSRRRSSWSSGGSSRSSFGGSRGSSSRGGSRGGSSRGGSSRGGSSRRSSGGGRRGGGSRR